MKRKQGNKREMKVGSLFLFHLHGEEGGRIWLTVCLKWDINLNLKHISYAWIHWKVSPGESGVPMILYRHNDLGMRLQKLTASFGLLRSELMNYSQMGVVNFALRLFRDNGDTIGAIHYCLKVMKCSFRQWRARATFAYQKSMKCLSVSLYQPCNCKQSCYFAFMAKLMVKPC